MEENKNNQWEHKWEGHKWPGGGGGFRFVRWLLGLFILLIVLWIGVKIGEFKGYVRGGWYGGPMMGGYYGSWGNQGWGMPMMGPWNYYGGSGYYGPGMMGGWGYPQATTTQR